MYILTRSITNNITKASLKEFVKNLNQDDYNSTCDIKEYISELINSNRLKISVFNKYLFEELFYGQQKDIYVHQIYSFNLEILSNLKLDKIISKYYDGDSNFNRIATTLLSNEDEKLELVACKTRCNRESGEVNNIKFLFAYRIKKFNDKNIIVEEHSYIPIEVDLIKKILITKVYPKNKLCDDKYKPDELYEKYTDKIMNILGITLDSYDSSHKRTLYNMSEILYMQIYNKMISTRSNKLDKKINDFCTEIISEISIDNIDNKKKINNIFDINYSIKKYFDQLLITDIIKSRNFKSDEMDDIDGIVTYLRFNDGTNVSAKVSGENYKSCIYTSETYMALRDPIENANKISEIKVIWILDDRDVRVKYNTQSYDYLYMHFYKNFSEEDFMYGYKKYKEYESTLIPKTRGMAK